MSELIKDISSINFADYNPRVMKEPKDTALGKSMGEFGDLGMITNNLETSTLCVGQQRVRKLREKYGDQAKIYIEQRFADPDEYGTVAIGYIGVPGTSVRFGYREVRWPLSKELAANVSSNNATGENDDEKLAKLDYELSQFDNGAELLAMTGQDEKHIQKLMESIGVVEPPPLPPEPENKSEKLEFSLTRDQRLFIERAIEHIKSTRDLQAIETASLNGSALFVMASDYLTVHPEPVHQPGELTDIPS